MINNLKQGLFILSLLFSIHSHAAELNQSNSNKFPQAVDAAITSGDIDSYANLLSDDASIKIKIILQGRQQAIPYSKKRYIKALKEQLASIENYTYGSSNLMIKVIDDKAFVTADSIESMTVGGRKIVAETQSEATIKSIDGVLLMTEASNELAAMTSR